LWQTYVSSAQYQTGHSDSQVSCVCPAYLGGLIERYNGSYILAFAAYNAGPNRADQWIKDYGDPRDGITDPIDWIEHIPFRETRNYVMRVTESLYVYRARLTGKTEPIAITKDLRLGKN
jgi:soluble lytic murein transglycosylase